MDGAGSTASPATSGAGVTAGKSTGEEVLDKKRLQVRWRLRTELSGRESLPVCTLSTLQELVKEVDPHEQLDEDVEELLLQIADDFIEQTVVASCALAKHRKSPNVDVRDVQMVLEKNFNMWTF